VGGHGVYPGRIALEDHTVGQLFWLQMKMETRAVVVDDQL
jgi:hypothetical protein